MLYDSWRRWARYRVCSPEAIDAVARFQRAATPELAAGRFPLLGDRLYASVIEARTKPWAETLFEAHRDYADVQTLLSGREDNAWAPRETLASRAPHDAEQDYELFDIAGAAPEARFALGTDRFAFYAPGDAHLTLLCPTGAEPAPIKKIVYKIHCALLTGLASDGV